MLLLTQRRWNMISDLELMKMAVLGVYFKVTCIKETSILDIVIMIVIYTDIVYVYTCLHGYIYAWTYIYAYFFNGDGFYEHFMISFTIYHLHNITSECPYNIMRCYFMMLNFKCTVSYFTVLPCMLFYLKCVLCITIIMCFVSNDEIKMFNHRPVGSTIN